MTDVRKLVKGERLPLPVSLVGGSGMGWVTTDPKVDGLLIVPRCGAEAVILSDSELADFGYVRKTCQRDQKKAPQRAKKKTGTR